MGSKNFTEQIILAEMLVALIESGAQPPIPVVDKRLNLGGTFVCFNGLKDGQLDVYVEYTGTGLTAILKQTVIADPDSAYATVEQEFKTRWNLVWLKPLGFNNTYTLTMRKTQAESLGITTVSDLIVHKDQLLPGFNHEFLERPDGYQGLVEHYGFKFSKSPKEMDTGLMYKAVAEKMVDVICGFATDGRIRAFDLVALDDDKGFFPPYYAAPLVRAETLRKHPGLRQALNALSGKVTNEEMAEMNYRVDKNGEESSKVAREFLEKKGLI